MLAEDDHAMVEDPYAKVTGEDLSTADGQVKHALRHVLLHFIISSTGYSPEAIHCNLPPLSLSPPLLPHAFHSPSSLIPPSILPSLPRFFS